LRVEQAHSGGELGLDVDNAFTGAHQLLRQQVAQTRGVLHRPGPLREPSRPGQQPLELGRPGTYLELAQGQLGHVNRHGGVRSLVRVDTDHHRHDCSFVVAQVSLGRHV